MSRWTMLAVLLAACGRAGADKAGPPPSIVAMIQAEEMDSTLARIEPERRDRPATAGEPARSLQLWRLDGKPAKLVLNEVSEVRGKLLQSTWYFKDGAIVFASDPDSRFAYVDGHLAEVSDASGIVTETSPDALRTTEAGLRAEADGWLKEFGS